MEIKLYALSGIDSADFVTVNLCPGKAPAVYAEGTDLTPAGEQALNLYLEPGEFKALQKAGRTLADFGVYAAAVHSPQPLSVREMVFFMMGMFDGRHDLKAAFAADPADLARAEAEAALLCRVRELANTSSKVSTPAALLQSLFALCTDCCRRSGRGFVKTTLISRSDPDFARFTGLNAVGMGSVHEPCMGMIEYIPEGAGEDSPLDCAMVGKGITFDSGGYDLKPSKFMADMRTDKTGAVTMAGVLALAILQGLQAHVKCYLPCTENLVSGTSMLPGDIFTYANGVSVEINNTDAEGRLILADGLLQAAADGARAVIDAATLTGAAKTAVGRDITAVLTPSNQLPAQLVAAFAETEEELWPLPMRPYHKRYLKSRRADLTNAGSGEGAPGASTAAAFLQAFVPEGTPWLHFDLSSAYMAEPSPYYAGSMSTGAGVYALARYLATLGQ